MVTGAHADTGTVTTMATVVVIRTDIEQAIEQAIMLAAGMPITDPHPIPTGQQTPTICITTVHRELEVPVAISIILRRATGWRAAIVPDPQHNLPTGQTMFIPTGMEMYTEKTGTTGTG